MDSPLLETRPCPTCPGLIAGADPHRLCFECLGPDHAGEGVKHSPPVVPVVRSRGSDANIAWNTSRRSMSRQDEAQDARGGGNGGPGRGRGGVIRVLSAMYINSYTPDEEPLSDITRTISRVVTRVIVQ